uniref:Cna B-type protein n=1 Tax=Solibacter usitatus (strain Ellin6076) TaxID=234267 RepID=Q01R02_SOLUE
MTRALLIFTLLLPAWAQEAPALSGTVTDPSGAVVPGVTVQLRGAGRDRRVKTDRTGRYAFGSLAPGSYEVRFTAKGFAVALMKSLRVERPEVFDVRLVIGATAQVINVEDQQRGVSAEADSNGSAIVMRERQIAALSDDPDELALQLQALAGPAPGPGGGQIFIDGFTGGNLPPKSSIREIRINANPFSPEYDRPGFSRVEIFTKPGSDALHGSAFTQYGDTIFNSRNPLFTQSTRPPYRSQMYGLSLGGPLRRNKASFSLDAEHRQIDENAFVLATTPDGTINQALGTPQSRTNIRPRLDYSITPRNTLVVRYQYVNASLDNQGVGDFNLASRGYNERQTEQTVQATETAMLNPRAINETRFQYLRAVTQDTAGQIAATVNVEGAFTGGGATAGNSGTTNSNWELTNISTFTRGTHAVKWGGRVRQSRLSDLSVNNFSGTFTFYTLADYEAGRPAQFSINTGTPLMRVVQTDAGLFVSDDWRVRPNLTLSYGLRYEAQSNFGGTDGLGPRLGIAWALNKKTVVRAGAGTFFDRIPISVTLNERRYNGITQQSYFILNPTFYPVIPSGLTEQPQQVRRVAGDIRSPRLYQTSVGLERQLTQTSRLTVTWVNSRGVHLLNVRNLDQSLRLLTESAGESRQNQVLANLNASYKKLTIFGNYALSYGRDDNEGLPADPYNLRAEWGPSSYGDIRHRAVLMASVPLPGKFAASPFFVVNSGAPYNITTGLDPNHTGAPTARPGLVAGPCEGRSCYTLNPAPGTEIEHNYGRGPGAVNLGLRVSRTWSFGPERSAAPADTGSGHGGMPGMSSTGGGRRYGLTLTASSLNALNHVNFAAPNGDLSSPYFGQYRALGGMIVMNHGGGASTYNRKIDLQLRFTF